MDAARRLRLFDHLAASLAGAAAGFTLFPLVIVLWRFARAVLAGAFGWPENVPGVDDEEAVFVGGLMVLLAGVGVAVANIIVVETRSQ